MITISLRLEEDMKKDLEEMCNEMGMNLTTFFMIYAKRALRDRKIPFQIEALPKAPASVNAELMTSEQLHAKLEHSYNQIAEGRTYLAAEALEKYSE